ncbi:MAG: hypothetical protein ABIP72_04620 [Acidimicrobiales bacterium]
MNREPERILSTQAAPLTLSSLHVPNARRMVSTSSSVDRSEQ